MTIEVILTVTRQLFYNSESNFGIYGATVDYDDISKVQLNRYNNITIKGTTHQLDQGSTYNMELEEVNDKKYGISYNIVKIKMDAPASIDEQREYIKSMVTPLQFDSIMKVYEGQDIIQLLKDNSFDYNKVYGFGQTVYEKFRDKILKNLELIHAVAELSPYGLTYNMIVKLMNYYASATLLIEEIHRNPYILLKIDGFGFIKCDAYALKMGIEPDSPYRIEACTNYVLEEKANNDGHCWISIANFLKETTKLLDIDKRVIRDFILNEESQQKYQIDATRIGLMRFYKYEELIFNKLMELKNTPSKLVVEDIDAKIKFVEEEQGFEFTDEQRLAIKTACESNIFVLNGKAGTGKTATLRGIAKVLLQAKVIEPDMIIPMVDNIEEINIENQFKELIKEFAEKIGISYEELLEDIKNMSYEEVLKYMTDKNISFEEFIKHYYESQNIYDVRQNIRYMTCALSGKAAQRISESTGMHSSTIHRMLGYSPMIGGFSFNDMNPLPFNFVVLDEASMVNNGIFKDLMIALTPTTKFIILGDTEQLEPIGAGNVLKDFIETGKVPKVTLTIVHRQAMKSGILSTANKVREGIQFINSDFTGEQTIGELKDLHLKAYSNPENVYKKVINVCKRFKGDLLDFQVIVPLKARGELCTKNLNKELQDIFNPDVYDEKATIEIGSIKFRVGDKIIQNGNNYAKESGEVDVFNGTLGMIKSIEESTDKEGNKDYDVYIDFVGIEGEVVYNKEKMRKVDLAYALTVHRVQGSQFKYVVFAMDYSAYVLLSRQLVYTALTRASLSCILIAQTEALRHAVATDKSSKRNTFLRDMLEAA
jgi:RecD/TraA family predicted helicase